MGGRYPGRMSGSAPFDVRRLGPGETGLFRELLVLFGRAFEDMRTYTDAQPDDAYLEARLADPGFFLLAAMEGGRPIGALAAYELRKFEQARSEIYIYDLAVEADRRRRGVATALIEALKGIGVQRGAYAIFVQADPPDAPAVALYDKLGTREEVLHFDIAVE